MTASPARPVNISRMMERIEHLAEISSPGPGVTRLPLTEECEEANAVTGRWMEEAGMAVRRDAVNNLIGRYDGTDGAARPLMLGSHLDSVIQAGRFDGVLGVIAGVEVVSVLAERGIRLRHPIEVVAFTDEEGIRFDTSLVGSRAMAGTLAETDLAATDRHGVSLAEALREQGLEPSGFRSAARPRGSILAYLELHIEQGPILEKEGQPCGVVTGITGAARYRFRVEGVAGHAGTVPMPWRRDALAGAAELVLGVERVARERDPLVATVGQFAVAPGAANVIPGLVEGTLDIRALDDARRLAAYRRVESEARRICAERGLACTFEPLTESPSVRCAPHLVSLLQSLLAGYGMPPLALTSGAGHDAMAMARITDVGMLFVRCRDGLSHRPEEHAAPSDIARGTEVLRDAVIALAS